MPISFGAGGKSTPKRKSSQISLPVTDSLVAYFDVNNANSYPGAGTVWRDLTSRNQVATVNTSITSYANRYGGHLVMTSDGVNTPASFTASNFPATNAFTFMAWINPNATQVNWAGIIIDRSGGNFGTGIQFADGGNTTLRIIYNGTNYTFNTGIVVPPNKWSLVTMVVTPTTVTPYLNGVAGNVLTGTFDAVSCASPRLGWDNGASRVFQGKYGAALIYNKSLSAAEVSSMYDFFKTRYIVADNNLRVHVDAGDSASYSGSGTAWTDISGSGNNVTLNTTPTFSNGRLTFSESTYGTVTNGSSIIANSPYTKSVWVRFSNLNGFKNLISGNDSSPHAFWAPASWDGRTNKVQAGHNSSWGLVASNTTIEANKWYNLTLTFSTTNGFCLYVNGQLEGTNTSYKTNFNHNSGPLYIGAYQLLSNGFNGQLASALVYNKELSAAEISQNFNATKGIFYPTDFPASVPGLQLWLRGDSGVYDTNGNLITADNTAVAAWADSSSVSSKIFAQPTATQRPVLRTGANGVNGRPVLSFDGVDDELFSATNPTPTSNFSYFAVVKPLVKTGSGHTSRFAGRISGATGWNWGCTTTNFYSVLRDNAGTGPDIYYYAPSGTFSSPILSSVIMDSTQTSLRINGNQVGTSTRTNWQTGGTTEYIGSDGVTTASRFQGHICEILVFNRALTGKELTMVEMYLNAKWGIYTQSVISSLNPAIWLDANDSSTITQSSNSVSQWSDKSGNARHFTQGTGTQQPTYNSTTFSGRPAITFDGVNDMLSSSAAGCLNVTNVSFFMLMKWESASGEDVPLCLGPGNALGTSRLLYTGTTAEYNGLINFSVFGGDNPSSLSTDIGGGYHIVEVIQNGNNFYYYRDGVADSVLPRAPRQAGVNAGSIGTNNAALGNLVGSGSHYSNISVAETLIFYTNVSDESRQRIEGYLAHKWGLTANLPANHPYKVSPP